MPEKFPSIQAAAERGTPIPKTSKEEIEPRVIKGEAEWEARKVRLGQSEIGVNLAEDGLEAPIDLNLAEGGEQNPDVIDLEGKHKDLLTPEEAHARREQFQPSKAAVAEAAAAAAAAKAAHAEILAGLAREKMEAAAKAAEVLANLQRKAQEVAAEKIAEAGEKAKAVAQAVVEQQEATNPQGTNPEDKTVN